MSEEIDLSETERKIGQLLPVLVNQKGEIVDGRHRLKANKNWKKLTVDLNDLQTHVARLVINTQRRIAEENDYNELAAFLQKTEPGDEDYRVKSGISIAKRISELTGINLRTVRRNLSCEFKQEQDEEDNPSTLRETTRVPIPDPLAEPVREMVDEIKKFVEAEPEKAQEIIENCGRQLKVTAALSKPMPKTKREKQTLNLEAPEIFLKKLAACVTALSFLGKLPPELVRRIIDNMDQDEQGSCRKLIASLLGFVAKLREAA